MSGRLGRILTPHGSRVLDAGLVAAALAVDLVGVGVDAQRGRLDGAGTVGVLVAVAGATAAACWWRRHRPLTVAAAVVAGYVVAGVAHEPGLVTQRSGAQVVVAVFAVASWAERWRRVAAVAVGVVAVLAAVGTANDGQGAAQVVAVPVALLGAPWFAGAAARLRRRHLAGVEERLLAAEADREARARQAVADERARIARELHDVVAHHVSLIGVQAGAARTTLDRDGEATRRALTGIEASSREAVREMRRLLDVLDGDGGAPLVAPPGPAEFDALAAGFAAAGLDVRCTRTGDPGGLGAVVALTLYRIAEEALTNVTRHSQAGTCTLALHVDDHLARVVVVDPGPSHRRAPVPPPGAGRGLAGMRERAALFGGTLHVGPTEGGGFVVDATLPRSS